MRFFLDQDVDTAVGVMLRQHGHDCIRAADSHLSRVDDDELTIYCQQEKRALITHDRRFSQRRSRQVIGLHVWLDCDEPDAANILGRRLDDVLPVLERKQDLTIRITTAQATLFFGWK